MTEPASLEDLVTSTGVSPLVALALLEALRSTDTPEEVLEDEHIQSSLPRRLGLSDAVGAQIRRYERLAERKETLGAREVADLLVLVHRRPDASDVFRRAGAWLARQRRAAGGVRRKIAGAPLPGAVRRRLALRTARRVAELINPDADVRTETGPPAVVVEGSLPAAAGTSDACQMVEAALAHALDAHGVSGEGSGRPPTLHPLCEARGDSCCVWRLAE